MFSKLNFKIGLIIILAVGFVAVAAYANHSWGGYHWARTANPFTLKLGDNVSTAWDAHLASASTDWTQSNALNTLVVSGQTDPKRCRSVSGRVEVCSNKYGFNGWLGVASIWVSGSHITKGTVKMNDSYFNTVTYNTPPWRRLVMCQEVGHTLGLDHQDENFSNSNLGTCMDYTSDPDGPPSNEHPNAHDYEQLEAIYAHLDSITTLSNFITGSKNRNDAIGKEGKDERENDDLGKSVRRDGKNKTSLYERDLGKGEKVFTFILWAE